MWEYPKTLSQGRIYGSAEPHVQGAGPCPGCGSYTLRLRAIKFPDYQITKITLKFTNHPYLIIWYFKKSVTILLDIMIIEHTNVSSI